MDVSIIFINYKTAEMTNDAVNSVIEKSSGFDYEIVVVDNSNDAEEFEKLKNLVGEKAKVINANGNLGFGKGNNLGVENSIGDYILFLNTDTLLVNNAIFELYNFLKNNDSVGAVGPNLYTQDLKPNHSYINYENNLKNELKQNNIFNIIKRKLFKRQDFNFSNQPKNVAGYICGASLMIKREYFENIGGFDKDIFMYAEDALLCYQVINILHKKLYNIPTAKIIHFEGGSIGKNSSITPTRAKMMVDGNIIFYSKVNGSVKIKDYLTSMEKMYRKKSRLAKLIFNKSKYTSFKNLESAFRDKLIEVENKGETLWKF